MSNDVIPAEAGIQPFIHDAKSLLTFGFSGSRVRLSTDKRHGMTVRGKAL